MAQVKGKQIKDGSIAAAKVDASIIIAAGTNAFTGDQAMGTNKLTGLADGVAADDAVNKGQLDAASIGITWKEPAAVIGYLGNRTIIEIEALTPVKGQAVVATFAGTPTTGGGSDALVVGDIAEFDGTNWKKIVAANGSNFVPVGTRAIIAAVGVTLELPLTDVTDNTKVAVWDGTSNTPSAKLTKLDGEAILINAEGGVNENKGYVYDTLPTATWVEFTGLGLVDAGAGLAKTGNTLDIGETATGAIQVNADSIEVLTDDVTIEDDAGAGPAKLRVKDAGIDENKLNASVAGNGIAGGAGSALSVQADGDTITVGAGGVKGTKATTADKAANPSAPTAGNDVDSTITIAATPVGDRYIQVFVNGLKVEVGDALKTKDCFFSVTASTPFTARALSAIVAGDKLIWNGVVAGYDLETDDAIDLDYNIPA